MSKQKLVNDNTYSLFPAGYRVLQGEQEFVTYPDNSTIRIWLGETPDQFTKHWHTAAEILIVLDGACKSEANDREYLVKAGEVLITPPRCPHTLSMAEGSRRCLIIFEVDVLEQMRDFAPLIKAITDPIHISAQTAERSGLMMTLNRVISLYRFREPMWNTLCYSLLLQVCAQLGQLILLQDRDLDATNQREKRMGSSPEVMESVLGYIDQHYMNNLMLDEIAAYAGYSKSYFLRMFKNYSGMTFAQYLVDLRVAKVRQRLIHDQVSVAEIFKQSGFSSKSSFNRAFKEQNGCTPSEYRAIYSRHRRALESLDDAED